MSLGMDRGAPWLVHGHRRKGEDQRQLGSRCGGGHGGSLGCTCLDGPAARELDVQERRGGKGPPLLWACKWRTHGG